MVVSKNVPNRTPRVFRAGTLALALFSSAFPCAVSHASSLVDTPGKPASAAAGAATGKVSLERVLQQMDAASAKFQSARADFKWDQFTLAVNDTDTQRGVIYFKRRGSATEVAATIDEPNSSAIAKELVYKDGTLDLYQPKIDDLKEYPAGKNSDQYESFLALGFGGRGSDLAKNWTVTLDGMETLSDGAQKIQTAKLTLVPKQKSVSDMFTHVTMWVDTARGISLLQKSYEPSGDIRTASYSSIRYNEATAVPDSAFKIHRVKK